MDIIVLKYFLVPKPIPTVLNIILGKEKDIYFYHIFYKASQSSGLEYIKSSSCTWADMFKNVEKAVIETGHGTFGIKLGIRTDQDEIPLLLTEPEFLKTSACLRTRFLIIIATSDTQRKFNS